MPESLHGIQRDRFHPDMWPIIERVAAQADRLNVFSDRLAFACGNDRISITPTDVARENADMVRIETPNAELCLLILDDGRIFEPKAGRRFISNQRPPQEGWRPEEMFAPPLWPKDLGKNTLRAPTLLARARKVFGLPPLTK